MKAALDVHQALLSRDVPHEIVRLARPLLTADDLPAVLDLPAEQCLVVRCYVADGQTVAVLVAAGSVPDPLPLLQALGAASLRTASAPEVNAATDCAAALVSPVGLPPGLTLLVDAALDGLDVVYTPAAEAGVALGIRLPDLLAATGARSAALSARPLAVEERPWDGTREAAADVVDLRDRHSAGRASLLPDAPPRRTLDG